MMRDLDNKENDCIKEFAHQGYSCDYGTNRTPCCLAFRAGLVCDRTSHNTFLPTNHTARSPQHQSWTEERNVWPILPLWPMFVPNNLLVPSQHWSQDRGSRASRQACWRMYQLWEYMGTKEGSRSITYLFSRLKTLYSLSLTTQIRQKSTFTWLTDLHTWWYTYMHVFYLTKQRLMCWSFLAKFLGIKALTYSSSPAAPPNIRCGICTRKQQQWSPCVMYAIPPSPLSGGSSFLMW